MKIKSMILIAPTVGFLFMLVLGGSSYVGLETQQEGLNEIVSGNFRHVDEAHRVRQGFLKAHSTTYRLISWIANYDEAKIKAATKDILGQVDGASDLLKHFQDDSRLSEQDKKSLSTILAAAAKYRKNVDSAIDLASADPASGAAMMQSADAAFQVLSQQLDALVTTQTQKMTARYNEAQIKNQRIHVLGGILLLCALASSMLCAMYYANRIFRKLGGEPDEASEVMQRLAQGDTNIDIHTDEQEPTSVFSGMKQLVYTLKNVVNAQQEMANKHAQGQMDYRISLESLNGVYQDVAKGTNDLVNVHLNTTEHVINLIKQYSRGQFDELMPKLPGQLANITDAMNAVRDVLQQSALAAKGNARIRAALDNSSTLILITNVRGDIRYINHAMQHYLEQLESEFHARDSEFAISHIMGANVQILYGNIFQVKDLKEVVRSSLQIGSYYFDIVITPVFDESGESIGAISEWMDKTDERCAQTEIASLVNAAAAGDFSHRLHTDGKQGFFSDLATTLNLLVATTQQALQNVGNVLQAIALGDLTQRVNQNYSGQLRQIAMDTNATAEKLTQIVEEIKTVATNVALSAGELSAGNMELSRRTEGQAASVEETSSTMHQLTTTVQHNKENVNAASDFAQQACTVAEGAGQAVSGVVQAMQSIQESAKHITDITAVIDSIAFQTNILALNAAVEAARAGEQGRGFAVVAAEVRSLAQRSGEAARQIRGLIQSSATRIEAGAVQAQMAGETMHQVVRRAKEVTQRMDQINRSGSEQASGIQQVNQAVALIERNTQQNAALVEESTAAAQQLEDQARHLEEMVSVFQIHQGNMEPGHDSVRHSKISGKVAAAQKSLKLSGSVSK